MSCIEEREIQEKCITTLSAQTIIPPCESSDVNKQSPNILLSAVPPEISLGFDEVQKEDKEKSTVINKSKDEIVEKCENLNPNEQSLSVQSDAAPVKPKAKRVRKKKDKLQKLNMSTPQNLAQNPLDHTIVVQSPQTSSSYLAQFQVVSVHDFFVQNISPLYANTTSRFLENMSHHPQFQYMNNVQKVEYRVINNAAQQQANSSSAPSTPHNQSHQLHNRIHPMSIPNTPVSVNQNQCRYFQNALHHPLLNPQYSAIHQENIKKKAANQFDKHFSGRKKGKNKSNTTNNFETHFDSYLNPEEVAIGLENKTLVEGVLRVNPKQFQHSYVSSSDRNELDIFIDGMKNRNRSLEGDLVVVEIINDGELENNEDKQRKGKVVFIKEKVHTRTCIGLLKLMQDKNRQKALFVPRDHRVPRLNIPFTCWPDNFYKDFKKYENILFLAQITEWFDTRFAMGKIVCSIGQSGDMVTETKAILAQTDLDVTPFGPEIRHLFPRLDYSIPEEEINLREDCRNLCLFSIDPSNCRDIDDAVSCKELENGNYEIGVHISDVAHFLTEDTILDEKVAEKATTVYLVERAYHMLPDELCMLCSLFPGVDKLAFSVFWEITKDAKVVNHRFSKSVIHSCSQLAYEHAQAILEDQEDSEANFPETYNGFEYKDIKKTVKILGGIASTMRRNRFEGGALRIDQPKVSFGLNVSSGLPETFWIYENKESHQLIEEFMLLANMTVAERINEDHPKLAFLRCHPEPSGFMLQQLAKSLKPMGIELDISSAGDLHRSLLPYVGPDNDNKGRAMVLNMLCAKPMTRAKYFCADGCDDDDFRHYALNVPLYTHFTSPIRRYADIMVHRLLAASLKYRENPTWEVDKVKMIAAQCNKQKYNAKKAGELSTELYTLKYIELNSPLITEAVVVEVREKYIDVIVVAMGLNRRIFFNNDFPGEFKCIKNSAGSKLSKMQLTWRATDTLPEVKQEIEIFSVLKTEMHKGDDMGKIDSKLVRPI